MTKLNPRTLVIGMAFLVGVTLGLAVPKNASATSYLYSLALHPSGDSQFLSCGWHSGACWDYPTPVASGPALDWKPQQDPYYSDFPVYFKAKTAASGGQASAGTAVKVIQANTQCSHIVRVDIKDLGGSKKADTRYLHTKLYGTDGGAYTLNSGYFPVTTNTRIGTAVSESGCAWTGYHVHHERGLNFSGTTYYPDENYCNWSNVPGQCGYKATDTYPAALTSWYYP